MIEGVLFDVDGTLLDSVDIHAEAWRLTLQEFGFDIPFEKLRSQIGKGGDQLMPAVLPREVVEQRGKEIESRRGELFKARFMDRVRPFPCVREMFERLRSAGLKLALASSAKGDELEYYVELLSIKDLIHAGTTSDDAQRSKPHPDIFQAAMREIDCPDPSRVFVVGDSPYDAEAALKAGCRVIGFLCGGFPAQSLMEAGAEALFRDPEDLLRRFEESPLAAG